jgi:hypothetical protein
MRVSEMTVYREDGVIAQIPDGRTVVFERRMASMGVPLSLVHEIAGIPEDWLKIKAERDELAVALDKVVDNYHKAIAERDSIREQTARRAVEVVENQDVVESSNSPGENSARLEVIEDILAAIKAEFELDKGE